MSKAQEIPLEVEVPETSEPVVAEVELVPETAPLPESEDHVRVNQIVDAFWADYVANVGSKVPTEVHNTLHGLTKDLRTKLLALFL